MPAHAPDATARLWIIYTSAGYQHDMMLRFPAGTTAAEASVAAEPIVTAMTHLMRTADSVSGEEFAAAGSNVRLPYPIVAESGHQSNDLSGGDPESHYMTFVGRDNVAGSKVRYTVFVSSSDFPNPAKNRYVAGSVPGDAVAFINALDDLANAAEGPHLVSIAGQRPSVYNYVNTGFNRHWQDEQRA